MKKTILIILSCCMMLLICSGCDKKAEPSAAETADRLSAIRANGVLTVAVSPDYPPFEYITSGKLQGVDIELANALAEMLGVKLSLLQTDYSTLLAETAKGSFDLAISAISSTAERKELLLFSKPYLYSDTEYGYRVPVDEYALCVASAKDGASDTLITFVNSCIHSLTQEGKIAEWYVRYSELT